MVRQCPQESAYAVDPVNAPWTGIVEQSTVVLNYSRGARTSATIIADDVIDLPCFDSPPSW